MSLQAEYNEFCQGYWADPDPKQCRCRGSGYALSDLDTWHQCPYHWTKQTRHPEEDWGDEPNPDQSLVVDTNPQEKPKMPEDITEQDMIDAEFKPASPPPAEPLNDEDIPF